METTTTKAMTLRLSPERAAELEALARVDEVSVSAAVREAIDRHIESRRKDKEFQERRERLLNQHRDALERLA